MHWSLNPIVGNTFLVSFSCCIEPIHVISETTNASLIKFLAVIQAGVNITHICTQIKSAVDDEQNKVIWVPVTNP